MSETAKQPLWKSDGFFIGAVVLATLAIAWGMARYELVSRAKTAYFEGEKYYNWHKNPGEKKKHFDAELAAKKISPEAHKRLMEDSDIKMAYVWYETAVDLFQPPRSQWILKSEERLREVKPLRDAWLRSLGIDPVE